MTSPDPGAEQSGGGRFEWGGIQAGYTQIMAAFATAYGTLSARITAFLALPLDETANDRSGLQNELDRIGSIDGAAP